MRHALAAILVGSLFCAQIACGQEIRELPDVYYGTSDAEAQVLSARLLAAEQPSPVLVRIISGGWHSGKAGLRPSRLGEAQAFNEAGFATIDVNHRSVPQYSWPAQLDDIARAIQFVRSKAAEWNLDPGRISVSGRSSGAHLAMMLAFSPDRAKPDHDDPVLRQSSRVRCVINMAGPTDLVKQLKGLLEMEASSPGSSDFREGSRGNLLSLINVKPEEFGSEAFYRRLAEISPINYVTVNAPPVFIQYVGPEGATSPEDPRLQWGIHSPISGLLLAEKLKAAGVPHEIFISPAIKGRPDEGTQRQIQFLKKFNEMR